MAIVTTDNIHYKNIADAMREKTGKTDLLYPSEMADEVSEVYNEGLDRGRDLFRSIDDFYEFFAYKRRLNLLDQLRYDDTSNATNFSYMFAGDNTLTEIPYFDTSKGTDFSYMFRGCTNIKKLPEFDTSSATRMNNMFYECAALTAVPKSLYTGNCTELSYLFCQCQGLNSIPNLDTSKCTNFSYMFAYCYSLYDMPSIDTSKGTNFTQMFTSCKVVPEIDTSSGTNFTSMFFMCKATTIPRLNVSNSTKSLEYLFESATNLETVNFEGVIKQKIGFKYNPNISKATIVHVIDKLSSEVSGQTCIFKLASINKQFETSEGASDGSTSSEWASLVATKPNWTFSLV